MLTPLDIQNKIFKKEFRGYSMQEVDEFLNLVIDSYEKQYKENIELRDKIDRLNSQIKQYKSMENTLKETLVVAQSTGDQIQRNAGEKAENIISNAEVKAKEILEGAHDEVRRLEYKYEEIKRSFGVYCAKMGALVQSQLMLVDNIKEADRTLLDITGINKMIEKTKEEFESASQIHESYEDTAVYYNNEKASGFINSSADEDEFQAFDKLNVEDDFEGGFAVSKK